MGNGCRERGDTLDAFRELWQKVSQDHRKSELILERINRMRLKAVGVDERRCTNFILQIAGSRREELFGASNHYIIPLGGLLELPLVPYVPCRKPRGRVARRGGDV